jgi:hypothetical protein
MLGLGPGRTLKGDTVAIFLGFSVPVVLRKEDESYVVIGGCFIQGVMDGECFREGNYELQDFVLI